MRLECLKYLHDIRQACERLVRFVGDRSLGDLVEDEMLRSAVERQLEIIGEAMSQMLKLEPAMETQINRAAEIVAFRNQLIHRHAVVSSQLVWGVLHDYLPRLREEVQALLGEGADGECLTP